MDTRKARLLVGAVVGGLLTMTASCSQQPASGALTSGTHAASTASPASTASSGSTASPGSTPTAATTSPGATAGVPNCASPTLTVTAADNSKTLCVRVGAAIEVLLRGTIADRWTPIHASSTALAPRVDPRMTLMAGMTGAAYTATRPGTVIISAARHACPQPTATGGVGTTPVAQCDAMIAFRVSLDIAPDSQHG